MSEYPLHEAVLQGSIEDVVRVITSGAELNTLDANGHTALHWAVFGGYYEIVKLLLERGADPNVFSDDGVTPCWRAADFGLKDIEALLRSHGGRIATNGQFNRTAFTIMSEAWGSPLPPEDPE